MEWVKKEGGKVFDLGEEDVKSAGLKAVLRVPVGWSADHRVVSFVLSKDCLHRNLPIMNYDSSRAQNSSVSQRPGRNTSKSHGDG